MNNNIGSGNILSLACLLSLALLVGGCGSSPHNTYYRLTAQASAAPTGENPALGVGPITIPAYLDREKMVYQQQGNALKVSVTEHWAEPLDAGIERVLSINLASLLNTHNVRTFPWHSKRAPDYGVKLNLLGLDANDKEATLTAEWLVYRAVNAETVQRRISRLQSSLPVANPGPEQIPAAYSDLFHQLSEIIAAAISADMADSGAKLAGEDEN